MNLNSRKYQKTLFPSSTPMDPSVSLSIPSRVYKTYWVWCRTSDSEVFGSLAGWIMSVSSTNAKTARIRADNDRSERLDSLYPFCLVIKKWTVLIVTQIAGPTMFTCPNPRKGLNKNDLP